MNRKWIPDLLFLSAVAAFLLATLHDPFFWDAIQLGSKHAHFFYQNHLHWSVLPLDIDSGHAPLYGYYVAVAWSLFGKSLVVSHLALWPFVLGAVWLLLRIGVQVAGTEWGYWLLPLVVLDPVVAGQWAGLGPDVVLIFFFSLSLYGLLNRFPLIIVLGVLGLCAVSMRGMMSAVALGAWCAFYVVVPRFQASTQRPFPWSMLLLFLPGFVFAGAFLVWHWAATGWVGYHPDSPWAPTFQRVGPLGWVRNAAIIAWRWADLGRWAEWIFLAFALWLNPANLRRDQRWVLLLCCTICLLSPTTLLHQNISAHRYFLPVFMVLHIWVLTCSSQLKVSRATRIGLLSLLCISLAFGNRWIYPRGVSMTWDSTLAHRPYHTLRNEMLAYLDQNGIPHQSVGAAFPALGTGEQVSLNGDARKFSALDWEHNQYILTSNVFNDIDLPDYALLSKKWHLLHRIERSGVWMELYQKIP
jgi:hypothetical protein